MIIAALGSRALGLLCGLFVFPPEVIAVMDTVMSYALAVLIFSVGIEVGTNKTVFRKIREYNVRILVIPFGVAAASIAGAVLVGLLFGMPVNESAAIGSGFGFYSISAVIMRELGGAQLGTIAFLTHSAGMSGYSLCGASFWALYGGRGGRSDRNGHDAARDRARHR